VKINPAAQLNALHTRDRASKVKRKRPRHCDLGAFFDTRWMAFSL